MLNVPNSATLSGIVLAEVAAAALLALDRRARDRLRHVEQVAQVEARVPAGVELAVAGDADARRALVEARPASPSASCISLSVRTMPTSACIVSCRSAAPCRGSRRRRRARTARATPASPRSTARRRRAARPLARAQPAAYSPARLPNTIRSDSELPPRRLAPLMPDAHSPAANRPGNRSTSASRRPPGCRP